MERKGKTRIFKQNSSLHENFYFGTQIINIYFGVLLYLRKVPYIYLYLYYARVFKKSIFYKIFTFYSKFYNR